MLLYMVIQNTSGDALFTGSGLLYGHTGVSNVLLDAILR
jgi:hypothetical protein